MVILWHWPWRYADKGGCALFCVIFARAPPRRAHPGSSPGGSADWQLKEAPPPNAHLLLFLVMPRTGNGSSGSLIADDLQMMEDSGRINEIGFGKEGGGGSWICSNELIVNRLECVLSFLIVSSFLIPTDVWSAYIRCVVDCGGELGHRVVQVKRHSRFWYILSSILIFVILFDAVHLSRLSLKFWFKCCHSIFAQHHNIAESKLP